MDGLFAGIAAIYIFLSFIAFGKEDLKAWRSMCHIEK